MVTQKFGISYSKEKEFHDWYTDVIIKSELLDYYEIRGFYIMRPAASFIWAKIKSFFDEKISKMGVRECYFPLLVTKESLEKEKNHLANFNPELAWITTCGNKPLDNPVALRPTSEAVMYPHYARWLRTYRDLPLRLNQWCSVVRWEVKSTLPFIRGREFLWQEGHSAFYNKTEAEAEVKEVLKLYEAVYEELLAVPVIPGIKSKKETFGGAEYTFTVEAFIPATGKGVQGATSHHLGQNFSRIFGIKVETDYAESEKEFVFQNSWGITTRSIGIAVMLHSDNRGFVCPPRVAEIQVVIVPCGIKAGISEEDIKALYKYVDKIRDSLGDYRVHLDLRSDVSPGFKFNHWEIRGVPLRVEIGFRDMAQGEVCVVRRDNSQREQVTEKDVVSRIGEILEQMHHDMLQKAKDEMEKRIKLTDDFGEFQKFIEEKNIVLVPWCGEEKCEDEVFKRTTVASDDTPEAAVQAGAKSLCIPFEAPQVGDKKCICCSLNAKFHALFGRSY